MNVLDSVTGDVRTPDKLVDGVNNTHDGRHMWLAPVLPGLVSIYVFMYRNCNPGKSMIEALNWYSVVDVNDFELPC